MAARLQECAVSPRPFAATLARIDWTLFHTINTSVATRDWLEDPLTALGAGVVPLFAFATVGLWFLARPYGDARWKMACMSGLVSAAVALLANQVVSHLWERPRPYVAHPALTHLLSAPSPDPSFPSDHAAAAFAIAVAVFAFSRRVGALFLATAALIGASRVAMGMHYPSDVLAGMLVGCAAAALVTHAGRPWIARLVTLLSRLSDPPLRRVWDKLGRRTLARS